MPSSKMLENVFVSFLITLHYSAILLSTEDSESNNHIVFIHTFVFKFLVISLSLLVHDTYVIGSACIIYGRYQQPHSWEM